MIENWGKKHRTLKQLAERIGSGMSASRCCGSAGVPIGTWNSWMCDGRQDVEMGKDTHQATLYTRANDTRLAAEESAVKCFAEGAAEDPKIAREFLRIRAPEEWSDPEEITVRVTTEEKLEAEVERVMQELDEIANKVNPPK